MSAICKYVNGPAGPVLFGMGLQHDTFKALAPTSAGAVMLDPAKGVCVACGESLSLGLKSADGDTAAIRAMMGMKKEA